MRRLTLRSRINSTVADWFLEKKRPASRALLKTLVKQRWRPRIASVPLHFFDCELFEL